MLQPVGGGMTVRQIPRRQPLPNVSGVPQLPQTGGYLQPSSWDITPDVQSQVLGVVSPQLQSAADIINRRSQMGSQMIGGLTNYLQGQMGQVSGWVSGAYKPEIKQARAIAGYGRDALTGAGAREASGFAQALAQMGPGIRGPGDIDLAQEGKGAGGAAYGTGIAELDRLIASRAASQTRAALEPSFAAMTGQQQQGLLAAQLARQLSEQQSQIMAGIPELTLNLQNQAYGRQQDERDYQLRLRQFNAQQAGARAGIVGPSAPTTAGRKAYWDKVAADRTSQDAQGRIWVGTTTGIRPATDPKTGRPMRSSDWTKNQVGMILATGVDPATGALTPQAQRQLKALGVTTGGGTSETTARTAITTAASLAKEATRHSETMAKLVVAQRNAQTSAQRAATAQAVASERARHNRFIEQHPTSTKKPPAPHRVGPGQWRTASGAPLGADAAKYWENQFQKGYTDGRGKLTAGTPRQVAANTKAPGSSSGGGTTGVIRRKKKKP